MASPGNQHCANCIGTFPFPVAARIYVYVRVLNAVQGYEEGKEGGSAHGVHLLSADI